MLQKFFSSYTFLCDSSLFFVLKQWRQFKQQKSSSLVSLNNTDGLLLQDNAILLSLELLKE